MRTKPSSATTGEQNVPTQTSKQTRFVGWWRRGTGSPWRRMIHDADETRCLNRLLNAMRGGDKIVLPVSKNPNAREQL